MQGEPEFRMGHQREEPVGAVARPLQQHPVVTEADLGLDESRAFTEHADGIPALLERDAVALPGGRERLFRVVEDIEIAREPRSPDQFVQRGSAGEVALAVPDAVLREEPAVRLDVYAETYP